MHVINDIHDIPGIKDYIRPGTSSTSVAHGLDPSRIPDLDSAIWRYMDFAQLVSLLDRRALFFCRADKLGDPFEGAWSNPTIEALRLNDKKEVIDHGDRVVLNDMNLGPVITLDTSKFGTSQRPDADTLIRAWQKMLLKTKEDARFTMVTCWHENDNESEAMWRLYASRDYGVAIRSSFGGLIRSFTSRLPDIVARVKYISYDTTAMPLRISAPFLHKRISFEHEREVRAVITEFRESASQKQAGLPPPTQKKRRFVYKARDVDYSIPVCDVGIYYGVDVSELVQEVVVSPYAPPWFVELIGSVVKRYGLEFPVRQSALAKEPQWDCGVC